MVRRLTRGFEPQGHKGTEWHGEKLPQRHEGGKERKGERMSNNRTRNVECRRKLCWRCILIGILFLGCIVKNAKVATQACNRERLEIHVDRPKERDTERTV
jgi:hypothetical protein